jgi:hypothetical protein
VALSVTRKLKNMGSWVWQLQRTDVRRKEIESMMAIVAKGDALNKADVQKTFDSESPPSPCSIYPTHVTIQLNSLLLLAHCLC